MTAKTGEIRLYKETGRKKQKDKNEKNGSFLSGVMILSLSTVIVKIIGLVYKIPMLRLLGSEGMGYFNSAYEIYALLCAISTAGLPVAMSVMISRSEGREGASERIFKISMKLFLSLGVIGSVLMMALSYPFAGFLGNTKSFYSILAISPTLFFICAVSAYRGYFQGRSQMTPTAVSQLIEALGKLILGILFASVALYSGFDTEAVAAFAVLGLLVGSAISALYLCILKRVQTSARVSPSPAHERGVIKQLLFTAVPVTLSAAVVGITKMIDMTMLLRRLQNIGYSSEQAFSVYGSYTTLAVPLFALAPALVSSVAVPLIPRLGSAIANNDVDSQEEAVNDSIRLTAIIAMPIGAGLTLFSREILELIFKGQIEAIETSAPLLTILGISVTLSCLITTGNSILQAYGHPTVPLVSMTVGTLIKALLAFILIGTPRINALGAPISTLFCDLTITAINLACICKYIPKPINAGKALIRPFISSSVAVSLAKIVYGCVHSRIGESGALTLAAVTLAAVLYVALCLILRVVDKNDISKLPFAKANDKI